MPGGKSGASSNSGTSSNIVRWIMSFALNRRVGLQLNPDPESRRRHLSLLTVLERLRPAGNARWRDRLFCDPDDGNDTTAT
jgi:hypothetical protein